MTKNQVNSFIRPYVLLLLTGLFSTGIYAQENGLQIVQSKNKVMIEGKVYYIHVVKKSETLYAIANAYGVTVDEITAENPITLAGIQEGQALKIPEHTAATPILIPDTSSTFKYHIVQSGQTLYAISKMYNCSVADLEQLNPEVKYNNIQVNQALKVPAKTTLSGGQISMPTSENYVMHKVERRETMYSLSRQYNTSIEAIVNANGGPEWKGLKKHTTIRIPVSKQTEQPVVIATPDTILIPDTTQTVEVKPKVLAPECNCDSVARAGMPGTPVNAVMILPFSLDRQLVPSAEDTLILSNIDNDQQKVPEFDAKRANNWMEFYQGTLLALQKIKKEGLSVNFTVLDASKEESYSYKLQKELDRVQPDFIIAYAESSKLKAISEYSVQHQIPLILPLSSPTPVVNENPYFIGFHPGDDIEMHYMAKLMAAELNTNFIVIHSTDSSAIFLKESLKQHISLYPGIIADSIHYISFPDSTSLLLKALSSMKPNYAVVISTSEELVSDILRNLSTEARSYPIKLAGLHDWSKFHSIDLNYFHQLELKYFIPFYIDRTNPEVISYLKSFMAIYQFYPYKVQNSGFSYSMLGYDMLYFITKGYAKFNRSLAFCINYHNASTLLNQYQFSRKTPADPMVNTSERLIQYTKNMDVKNIPFFLDK